MNWHVEVVRLELVRHLPEALERVLLLGLLKAEGLHRLAHLGQDALRAAPVTLQGIKKHDISSCSGSGSSDPFSRSMDTVRIRHRNLGFELHSVSNIF
jgi:hypothetical protein